jgi:hypothetical protein
VRASPLRVRQLICGGRGVAVHAPTPVAKPLQVPTLPFAVLQLLPEGAAVLRQPLKQVVVAHSRNGQFETFVPMQATHSTCAGSHRVPAGHAVRGCSTPLKH